MKLADKVDKDKISEKFEKWPDRIILRGTSPSLLKKSLCLTFSLAYVIEF